MLLIRDEYSRARVRHRYKCGELRIVSMQNIQTAITLGPPFAIGKPEIRSRPHPKHVWGKGKRHLQWPDRVELKENHRPRRDCIGSSRGEHMLADCERRMRVRNGSLSGGNLDFSR